MKTRPDFRMPHSFVWLLLVAILCVAILPAAAVAKVDRDIATEGDPGDGLDSDGGSGGGSLNDSDKLDGKDNGPIPKYPHVGIPTVSTHIIIPVWTTGAYYFIQIPIYIDSMFLGEIR